MKLILLMLIAIPGLVLLSLIVIDMVKKKRWILLFFVWAIFFCTAVWVLSNLYNHSKPNINLDSSVARKIDFQPLK